MTEECAVQSGLGVATKGSGVTMNEAQVSPRTRLRCHDERGSGVTTNEAAEQSDRVLAPRAAKRSVGNVHEEFGACVAGGRDQTTESRAFCRQLRRLDVSSHCFPTLRFAARGERARRNPRLDVSSHCFPTLRFVARGARILPGCFAASFVMTPWPVLNYVPLVRDSGPNNRIP